MWYKFISDDHFFCKLYDQIPSLNEVRLISQNIIYPHNQINLGVEIDVRPDHIPQKWSNNISGVGMIMEFLDISDQRIEGFQTNNLVNINILKIEESVQKQVQIVGSCFKCSFVCGYIFLRHIHSVSNL